MVKKEFFNLKTNDIDGAQPKTYKSKLNYNDYKDKINNIQNPIIREKLKDQYECRKHCYADTKKDIFEPIYDSKYNVFTNKNKEYYTINNYADYINKNNKANDSLDNLTNKLNKKEKTIPNKNFNKQINLFYDIEGLEKQKLDNFNKSKNNFYGITKFNDISKNDINLFYGIEKKPITYNNNPISNTKNDYTNINTHNRYKENKKNIENLYTSFKADNKTKKEMNKAQISHFNIGGTYPNTNRFQTTYQLNTMLVNNI